MDSTQFDSLTKAWVQRGTRRGAVRLLIGGALGGALTLRPHPHRTAAAIRCVTADTCPVESSPCNAYACESGQCVLRPLAHGTPCEEGGNPCTDDYCDGEGTCIHPAKPDGAACGADRVCSQQHCCPAERPSFCAITGRCIDPQTESCGEALCAAGTTVCAGQCVNLTRSKANCGSCGHACPGRKVCRRGRCRRR